MAGDDKTALFATGHVEPELFFRRQSKEFASEASHVGDESGIDSMIDDLENTPILAGLDDFLANLASPAFDVVDSGERNDRDFAAEDVVGNLRAFIFVANKRSLESLLVR